MMNIEDDVQEVSQPYWKDKEKSASQSDASQSYW